MDHIISTANGGGDSSDNLQLLCRTHNASKGAGGTLYGARDANADHWRSTKIEGQQLHRELVELLREYLYHSDEWVFEATALAIMAAMPGFREKVEHLPIMVFNSTEPGSGKTAATSIAAAIIPTAMKHTAASKPSALARTHAGAHILDEAQGIGVHKGDWRAYANSAWAHDGAITMNQASEREGVWEAGQLKTFTSLWLSGLRLALADDTRTRSIHINMKPAPRNLRPQRFDRASIEGRAPELGRRIDTWAAKAAPLWDSTLELPFEAEARRSDVWRSLLAVAKLLGPKVHLRAIIAARDCEAVASRERERSEVEMLHDDLADILQRHLDGINHDGFVPAESLCLTLTCSYADTWGTVSGRNLTTVKLGQMLKRLDVGETVQRTIGGKRKRGYQLRALQGATERADVAEVEGEDRPIRTLWAGVTSAALAGHWATLNRKVEEG